VGGSIYVFLLELMKGQRSLQMSFKLLDVEILMPKVRMYHYYHRTDQSSPIWPWYEVNTFLRASPVVGAQYVTLQLKLDKENLSKMLVWLCKMVLAQHFCIVC
jgi:hypothetical protein